MSDDAFFQLSDGRVIDVSKVHVNIRPYIQPWDGKLYKFTQLGGSPILYLDEHDNVLCAECATENMNGEDGPVVAEVNWEDPDLFCDECSERIESAYAEDEASLPRDV